MKLKHIGFLLGLIFAFSASAQNEEYLSDIPSWVIKKSHLQADETRLSKNSGGEYPLLYDRQVNLDSKEFYYHWTTVLQNSESVSLYNTLEFSFDPSYQEIKIHFINIVRDGVVIDKIKIEDFKIITKEENADRKLYDNEKTLITHLLDIRQGDILDYAITKKGQNPAYAGHQYYSETFQSSTPMEEFYFSVLSSSDKLNYKLLNGAVEPMVALNGDQKQYSWSLENIDPNYYDDNTPSWYFTEPFVCFSDIEKWEDVAKLSQPFYHLSNSDLAYFNKIAREIVKEKDSLKMALELVHFVQDDIRYLGFEDGLNAFVPHSPKKVYDQRFGDCKDKSLLLTALLKSMGFKASPILVNTYLKNELDKRLPSPYVFNHCVAALYLYGRTYLIDPTVSNQGGDIYSTYFPDYGNVLNIESGELLSCPKVEEGKIAIDEYLDVPANNTKAASYRVKTTFTGANADNIRSYFASNRLDFISKEYMKFYSNMYSYIKLDQDLTYEDNRKENEIVTVEKYLIDSIWEKDDKIKGRRVVYVAPLMLQNYFHHQTATQRTDDYSISYPCQISYDMTIHTAVKWSLLDELVEIDNKEYTYRGMVTNNKSKREIHLQDMYWTKTDHVKAKDFPRFKEDHSKMYDDSSFGIFMDDKESGDGVNYFQTMIDFLIPPVLVIVAIVGLIVFNEKRKERNAKRRLNENQQ